MDKLQLTTDKFFHPSYQLLFPCDTLHVYKLLFREPHGPKCHAEGPAVGGQRESEKNKWNLKQQTQ